MSRIYSVRYVHKISNRGGYTAGPDVTLPDGAFSDRRAMGAALRAAGVIPAGTRLETFRVEGSKVVAFPRGLVWHSVILENADDRSEAIANWEGPDLA
jgi:hypothetical protein